MKYLTPEIAALSKNFDDSKSLVKRNIPCGIFQDCGEDSYDSTRETVNHNRVI